MSVNSSLLVGKATGVMNWNQNLPVSGFDSLPETGSLFISASPVLGPSDANVIQPLSGTIAVSGALTLNLNSIVDSYYGQAVSPSRAYQMGIRFSGSTWSYGPAASLGLSWFLSGTGPALVGGDGEGFMFFGIIARTIDNGTKNVTITNTGVGILTYTMSFMLGG